VVKTELMRAFTRFRDDAPSNSFMICEDPSGKFVQFVKFERGMIMLDLPSVALNPKQLIAAQRFLTENYQAECVDEGVDVTYNVEFPLDPSFLSYVTIEIFANIYGAVPIEPLKITIDDF
jgi:hypothetical protein